MWKPKSSYNDDEWKGQTKNITDLLGFGFLGTNEQPKRQQKVTKMDAIFETSRQHKISRNALDTSRKDVLCPNLYFAC